jgi:hypothetical protein
MHLPQAVVFKSSLHLDECLTPESKRVVFLFLGWKYAYIYDSAGMTFTGQAKLRAVFRSYVFSRMVQMTHIQKVAHFFKRCVIECI